MWLLAFASALCFDFNSGGLKAPAEPLALVEGRLASAHGTQKDKSLEWGAARAVVPKSPAAIYAWLLDHRNWKDPAKTEMKVKEEARPGFAVFHRLESEVRIFAFITVSWVEEWGYRVLAGSATGPTHFQVAYQKTEGTGHIRSLCGFIEGKPSGPGATDLWLYEQADASHYDAEKIEKMHLDNVRKLGGG